MEVLTQEKTAKVPVQQGLVLTEGDAIPIRDRPTQVEVAAVDMLPSADGIYTRQSLGWRMHLVAMLQPLGP
jgi:hypothetical protein